MIRTRDGTATLDGTESPHQGAGLTIETIEFR
jgi:hypothetical protein